MRKRVGITNKGSFDASSICDDIQDLIGTAQFLQLTRNMEFPKNLTV